VLSVGGTTLSLKANGDYASEVVWNNNGTVSSTANYATGGGVSKYVPKPNFQANVSTDPNPVIAGKFRGVVDVDTSREGAYFTHAMSLEEYRNGKV
jgi:hypothetical protein